MSIAINKAPRYMANGHQKPDHGGNFFMTPRRVLDSVAWRNLSFRARAILQVMQFGHNGSNNGRIVMSMKQIAKAIGNQNHKANASALAELIMAGFLECMSDADHPQSKAREYRITFISTGEGKRGRAATHEYRDWRPQAGVRRKYGASRTTMETAVSGVVATSMQKVSDVVAAIPAPEIPAFPAGQSIVVTTPHLDNQSTVSNYITFPSGNARLREAGALAGVELLDLKEWMLEVLALLGHGAQKLLAAQAGVPESVLSKFKANGRLPEHHRIPLQSACGRHLALKDFRASDQKRIAG